MSKYLSLLILTAGCSGKSQPVLPSGDFAVVTTSGGFGAGGAVNTIRLSDKMVVQGLDTSIDQDNKVRIVNGKAYVLNKGPGTLRIYDIKTWKQPIEIPTGDSTVDHATSTPQDVLVIPGTTKVYVPMGTNDADHALGVIDTAKTVGVEKWIGLPTQSADVDNHSEAFGIYGCAGKAYVLMGDYDSMTYEQVGNSRIAVVDTATDALDGFITLNARGPNSITAVSGDCTDVMVSQSGPFGKAPDGTAGIERVDLLNKKSLGMLITDAKMEGRPNSISIVSTTLAFASVYFDLQPSPLTGDPVLSSTKVIAFNPETGQIIGDVLGKSPFIAFATVTPDGQLFVGVDAYPGSLDEGKLGSGLYVGKADGKAISTTPIDLGQNPYDIAFQ